MISPRFSELADEDQEIYNHAIAAEADGATVTIIIHRQRLPYATNNTGETE